MTGEAMNVETIRERVNDDWNRIVAMLSDKIALASVSAQGITGEHMKRSAQFVADQMKLGEPISSSPSKNSLMWHGRSPPSA